MNIEILPPGGGKIKHLGHLITSKKKRSPSRAPPPHQMRVGNIHEPEAGVDVTEIPTERQYTRFLDDSDTVTPSLLHESGTCTMTDFRHTQV